MNAARRAWEALRRFLQDTDNSTEALKRTAAGGLAAEAAAEAEQERALIAEGVDPREAKIRAMKGFTDDQKEILVAELRRRIAAAGAPRFTREEFADELEARGSLLCDCDDRDGSSPTNPRTGVRMDHHCDCAAVTASAVVRRGESVTRHGRECGCLVVDNSARESLGLKPLSEEDLTGGARIYRFDRDE